MGMSLDQLNSASAEDFVALLDGVYEHSTWIAARAATARPFSSLAQLKHALATVVRDAARPSQLGQRESEPEPVSMPRFGRHLSQQPALHPRSLGSRDDLAV